MTSELKQAIEIAQSLTLYEQLELLKALSSLIQKDHLQEPKTPEKLEDGNIAFSAERFSVSWQQAQTGQTLPLSQIWEGIEDD
jgi:hypothetical protein